jgi:microcystin-dependent protein
VALTAGQIPAHTHAWQATGEDAGSDNPQGNYVAVVRDASFSDAGGVAMAADAIGSAGSSAPAPHNNLQPFLALNFIIALIGTYPSRS